MFRYLKPCRRFARRKLTPHKKADNLVIHGNFNLPHHDREDFLLEELKVRYADVCNHSNPDLGPPASKPIISSKLLQLTPFWNRRYFI